MKPFELVVEGGAQPLGPMVPVVNANGERQEVKRGSVITDHQGVPYVVEELRDSAVIVEGRVGHGRIHSMTLRRQLPRVKGKAAKKAAKRARQRARQEA